MLTVCHDCDLVCRAAWLQPGDSGRCPRCHASLQHRTSRSLQAAMAMAATALLLFSIINVFPLLAIEFQGVRRETTLVLAVVSMWEHDMRLIALLVAATTLVAPAVQIATELNVLWGTWAGRSWKVLAPSVRVLLKLRPWSMVEILMLGILVSLSKLRAVAEIVVGPALWASAALIVVMAALTSWVNATNVRYWTSDGQR